MGELTKEQIKAAQDWQEFDARLRSGAALITEPETLRIREAEVPRKDTKVLNWKEVPRPHDRRDRALVWWGVVLIAGLWGCALAYGLITLVRALWPHY